VCGNPSVRQAAQERIERGRRARQDRDALLDREGTARAIDRCRHTAVDPINHQSSDVTVTAASATGSCSDPTGSPSNPIGRAGAAAGHV
jgi:hypothetical protein